MLRYNYLKFLEKDKTSGINLYDLTSINWGKFKFKQGYQTYNLSFADVDRFYLVTQKFYDNLFNEDFLLLINRISDPTDLKVGQEILIPNINYINYFIAAQNKKQARN